MADVNARGFTLGPIRQERHCCHCDLRLLQQAVSTLQAQVAALQTQVDGASTAAGLPTLFVRADEQLFFDADSNLCKVHSSVPLYQLLDNVTYLEGSGSFDITGATVKNGPTGSAASCVAFGSDSSDAVCVNWYSDQAQFMEGYLLDFADQASACAVDGATKTLWVAVSSTLYALKLGGSEVTRSVPLPALSTCAVGLAADAGTLFLLDDNDAVYLLRDDDSWSCLMAGVTRANVSTKQLLYCAAAELLVVRNSGTSFCIVSPSELNIVLPV